MSGVDRGALDDLVAATDNTGEPDQPPVVQHPAQHPDPSWTR